MPEISKYFSVEGMSPEALEDADILFNQLFANFGEREAIRLMSEMIDDYRDDYND